MYFIVYKTTNLVNGKFYIGKHQTHNLDDGYLGSGKLLKRAIEKYGFSNFKREVLFHCQSKDELESKERELVTEDLVNSSDCYNLKLGGEGGFDYHNSDSEKQRRKNLLSQAAQRELMKDPIWAAKRNENLSRALRKSDKVKANGAARRGIPTNRKTMLGKTHSEHTRKMMSIAASVNNSQKGTYWATDGTRNLKLRGDLPDGFRKGRVQTKRAVGRSVIAPDS